MDNVKTRHLSLSRRGNSPTVLKDWLSHERIRCLSTPDLNKVRKEWESYQHSDYDGIESTKIQIDLLNIRTDRSVRRPQMRLKMGTALYYSKRSHTSSGDWNEGFVFTLSYHAQLFDTMDFDLYDVPHKHLPGTSKHIGKAKLKISTLKGKDDIFVTFLPIYEYHRSRPLPSYVFQDDTDSVCSSAITKRVGNLPLLGSLQIRIRYRFQNPFSTVQNSNYCPILSSVDIENVHPLDKLPISVDHSTSYGRGDLAQEEHVINDVFQSNLVKWMTSPIPDSDGSSTSNRSKHSSSLLPAEKMYEWIHEIIHPADKVPCSSKGRRFGFSQHDSDTSLQFNPDNPIEMNQSASSLPDYTSLSEHSPSFRKSNKKLYFVIEGVNFGDRNFASQWMHDSFDDVALSHPLLDTLIGSVVSKQTRAMVRAIIRTANSFGQGFRVTGMNLLKAALVLEKFYESFPKELPLKPVTNIHLVDNACHYFPFALIAYGWRGLCYLGAYGQYIRGGKDRRSNRIAIINYLNIHPEDLLGYEYSLRKGASFQPSYFVAIDRSRNALVLSIRGTWSLYDAITDLVCEYMPWKGGLVHSGMLASAQWFYTNIIPQLFRYLHHHKHNINSLIITGHSLGGGTASLLTMMVADHIAELRHLTYNPSFNLHCYTYAPAAVTTRELSKEYEQYIHSFVCQDDIVGQLSYGTAMKLRELTLDTISAYKTLGGFIKIMTDKKSREICLNVIERLREQMKTTKNPLYPSLYIPGIIIHIRRVKESYFHRGHHDSPHLSPRSSSSCDSLLHEQIHPIGAEGVSEHTLKKSKYRYSLYYTDQSISDEMVLTKTCIEDHMITAYNDAFKAIKAEQPLI